MFQKFYLEKGNDGFTHTSLKPRRSYYAPQEEDEFFKMYTDAYNGGVRLHMIEKHRGSSPFLVIWISAGSCHQPRHLRQLQLTESQAHQAPPQLQRKCTVSQIRSFLEIYFSTLVEYVDLEKLDTTTYLLGKKGPRIEKGVVKDGVHLILVGQHFSQV